MALSKVYLPMGMVSLLLAVTAVGAFAGGDESNPPSAGHEQVQAVQPGVAQALTIFEEPRVPGDALPPDIASRMDRHAPYGMNPDLSRLAVGNATSSVFVIPANGHVCASLTVGEGADLICPSIEDVIAGGAAPATVTIGTGDIAIYGIVPDGVDSVAVHADGAASADVETEGNAYYAVVPAGTPLRGLAYDGPGGPVEFTIHDPSAVFDDE